VLTRDRIILDLCGGSGSWSQPYRDAEYDVRLVTAPTFDVCRWRSYPDLCEVIASGRVYGVLAAPPCTAFSKANWRIKKRDRNFREGMRCVRACLEIIWAIQEQGASLKFWAIENPIGYLYQFLGYPKFIFQPWQFGETDFRATKRTALWGYFVSPAKTTRKRTIPFISAHAAAGGRLSLNKGWSGTSPADRAKTSEHFARAFFRANR
jgi:hypothetical protein